MVFILSMAPTNKHGQVFVFVVFTLFCRYFRYVLYHVHMIKFNVVVNQLTLSFSFYLHCRDMDNSFHICDLMPRVPAYLDEHSFITPDQFAYLKGHSTKNSLHRVIDNRLLPWKCEWESNNRYLYVMLDIAKCFDTIDHDLLLKKLSLNGIKNVELEWLKSYLHQRQQAVLCSGKLSSFCG